MERLSETAGNRSVEAYARAGRTKFEGRPTPADVAVDALTRSSDVARRRWRAVIEAHHDIAPLLDELPGDRMSPAAKRFVEALYAKNLAGLSHPIRTMAP